MPHSPRVNFDELKARADFRVVLSHYGLTAVGHGEQVKIHCPFHDDERPSCSVNFDKKLFHCFSCDLSGNVLDFVHRMEAIHATDGATVSLRHAGLKLAEICGLNRAHGTATQTRQEPRRASTARETTFSSSEGQNGALDRSTPAKTASPHATRPTRNKPLGFRLSLDPGHPYLAERGLSPETVALFELGFFAGEKGVMVGRVCIPIHNAAGELVAYAGRWALSDEELPEGEEKYKLPTGFHKRLELFNLHRIKHCKHLVVVEGFFDAIRLHSLRVPAVALMGSSLSNEQVTLLREHCPTLRFLTVMLDGDEAGRVAGREVAASLAVHWWTRIATLPLGSQPDTVESSVLMAVLGKAPLQG